MKYHQLVPARAINALSDWLVFNLEELGVEDPLVYSRLLLSLLHTTFHVNNIEQEADISYSKEFRTLNKSYQVSQLDTGELKRFAAVNLLIEATSNNSTLEQDNSTIVDLVNELYEKIREIEKETNCGIVEASVVSAGGDIDSQQQQNNNSTATTTIVNSGAIFDAAKQSPITPCSIEDLTKKYYSAFPALLNKELAGGKTVVDTTTIIAVKQQQPQQQKQHEENSLSWSNVFNKNCTMNISKGTVSGINSIKRKPKRKRPGHPKSKSCYIKKQSSDDTESLWDMNFEGTWEMGQDVVTELEAFKRNRSVSEGEVYHDTKIGKQYAKQKRHNNNCEDIVDFYSLPKQQQQQQHQQEQPYEDVTYYDLSPFQEQQIDQVAELQKKIDGVQGIWNDGWSEWKADSVWEPLERKNPVEHPPQQVAKNYLENNFDFIRGGMNLGSSIWSITECAAADDSNWGDVDKCKEICNNYENSSSLYSPTVPRHSHISLVNHSENSLFAEVIATPRAVKRPSVNQPAVVPRSLDTSTPEENLLLSEKTHFTPINLYLYPDGHVFPTKDSKLDVDYYRSDSGSLYSGSEKYLELECGYDLLDIENDDDPLPRLMLAQPDEYDVDQFYVKVPIDSQNEKSCQTDDIDFKESESGNIWIPHAPSGWRYTERILQDTKIDFVNEASDEDDTRWSMAHDCFNNNNNSSAHRIWEACDTCTDAQSFPANRLLKDELHADGEEILSDLNYLQSLIIGNEWDEDGTEPVDQHPDSAATDHIISSKVYHKVDKFVSDLLKPETTQTLAKALDSSNNWESVAENELLPFACLFNISSGSADASTNTITRTITKPDSRKRKISFDDLKFGIADETPPDKQIPVEFMNLYNYIAAAGDRPELLSTLDEFLEQRNARKRWHSTGKNTDNEMDYTQKHGYDLGLKQFLIDTEYYTTINAKYWEKNTAFIFKNNSLILNQIDTTRPLTR